MANKVEKDLKAFIKDVRKVAVAFYLRPREEDKVIAKKKAINVVEVNLTELEGTFVFRGIQHRLVVVLHEHQHLLSTYQEQSFLVSYL